MMTQERPGSTARGPQHVMMKLQIYNTSPHFGKGIVSIMMLVRQGSSLRAACAQMGLSYSKAWRLLKSAEADLGIPLLDTQKGGTKRAGSTLTPQGEELLDRYGLKRQRRYSPYMLSQGQQRRLAVLSVLAGGQELLLLDEPTYGQDARSVNAIMEHLREKVEQEGLTVIFITHDTELAAAWADKIYRLEDTALVEKSAEEVL